MRVREGYVVLCAALECRVVYRCVGVSADDGIRRRYCGRDDGASVRVANHPVNGVENEQKRRWVGQAKCRRRPRRIR